MPPRMKWKQTEMSKKLFLELVLENNLFDVCKNDDVPWQSVIEKVI